MRGTWISAAAAVAITLDAAGYAAAQQRQIGQDPAPAAQERQKDRDPPPGTENMDKSRTSTKRGPNGRKAGGY